MPKFEIELDDKGELVGQAPAEVLAFHERIGIAAHGNGFRSGQSKAGEEAKAKLDEAIKNERARLEASMPLEREKWTAIEEENKTLKAQYTDSMRESSRTLQKREEAHAEELTKRVEAVNRRNAKIQNLVNANLRSLAAQAGAREESLGELEIILQHRIGYDDDMEPYVKTEDGSGPLKTNTGTVVPMDAFVRSYLDNHPHHRKPTNVRGGEARRGATLNGMPNGSTASVQAVQERINAGDRSPEAINELFNAGRKQAQA